MSLPWRRAWRARGPFAALTPYCRAFYHVLVAELVDDDGTVSLRAGLDPAVDLGRRLGAPKGERRMVARHLEELVEGSFLRLEDGLLIVEDWHELQVLGRAPDSKRPRTDPRGQRTAPNRPRKEPNGTRTVHERPRNVHEHEPKTTESLCTTSGMRVDERRIDQTLSLEVVQVEPARDPDPPPEPPSATAAAVVESRPEPSPSPALDTRPGPDTLGAAKLWRWLEQAYRDAVGHPWPIMMSPLQRRDVDILLRNLGPHSAQRELEAFIAHVAKQDAPPVSPWPVFMGGAGTWTGRASREEAASRAAKARDVARGGDGGRARALREAQATEERIRSTTALEAAPVADEAQRVLAELRAKQSEVA